MQLAMHWGLGREGCNFIGGCLCVAGLLECMSPGPFSDALAMGLHFQQPGLSTAEIVFLLWSPWPLPGHV
jgi:hypothetical protein